MHGIICRATQSQASNIATRMRLGLAWLLLLVAPVYSTTIKAGLGLLHFLLLSLVLLQMMHWPFGLIWRIPYQVLIDFNHCSRLVFHDYFTRIVAWAEEAWEEVWE